jgi:vitamin B12 transporter
MMTFDSTIVMRRSAALGTILLSLGLAGRMEAQVADTGSLAPVVVTATRVPFGQTVSTATTTVITGDELKSRGIITIADALQYVPGATVAQTGSYGGLTSLFLRGGQSDYVRVLVDGVPLNAPGGNFYFQNLTTANIDRIEIVSGPTSVLYGSDAVTGVIQIFTKRGTGGTTATISARGGTYSSGQGTADVAGSIGPFGYSAGAAGETTAGTLPFNNQYRNGELSGRLDWGAGTATSAWLMARYHNSDYHYPTIGDGTPVDSNQHRRDEGTSLALEGAHTFSPVVDAQLQLTYNTDNAADSNPPDNAADTLGEFATYDRDVFTVEAAHANVNLHFVPRAVVTVGGTLEGQHDASRSADEFNFGPPGVVVDTPPPMAHSRSITAGYGEIVGNVGDDGSYTAGLRVDDNSAFGTFWTYRLGAGYAVGYGAQLRAAVGTAFKEPTFEQNFSTAPFDVGNPRLQPERSLGWEVGVIEKPIGPGLAITATYFNQQFRNLIDYTPSAVPIPGSPGDSTNYVNIAGANADGIELGLEVGPLAGTLVKMSYTGLTTRVTQNGVDTTGYSQFKVGTPLIRRPSETFSGTVVHQFGGRGSASISVLYVGSRDDINFNALTDSTARVVLPGYTTVDLSGAYRILGGSHGVPGFSLTLRVANLFNRQYQSIYSYAAPGRTVLAGGVLDIGG